MLAFAETQTLAATWLAAADDAPGRVHLWWANAGLALLAVGKRWDVVKTCEDHGLYAAATDALAGPIMRDPDFGHLYFLVESGATESWDVPGTEWLSVDCWLKVPPPSRTEPPGAYWIQPPDGNGTLVNHTALHIALLRGNGDR